MDHSIHFLLLLFLLLHLPDISSAAAYSPAVLPTADCSNELVNFSSCLPFIAASPNNLTDFPQPKCCDDVSTAFGNGSAVCLCYFLLKPKILGFPLNSTRLLSLTSVCPLKDPNLRANFSLDSLCSGSTVLPPLRSVTGPNNSKPRKSGAASPSPSLMGSVDEGSSSRNEPGKR